MSSGNDFHLHFISHSQPYDIDFQQQTTSSPTTVSIDGKNYTLLGEESEITWLKEKLPELGRGNISEADLKEHIQRLNVSGLTVAHKIHSVGVTQLSTPVEKVDNALEQVDSFLKTMVKEKDFRGQILIVRDGTPFLNKGYGVANESGGEITDQTIFHLGSITKQFTAGAIMLLQQKGKLHTNDLIKDHLPSKFADNSKWQNITIHQLLNHKAGIPNYGADEEAREYELDEIINDFKDKKLDFEPGTAYSYSNGGYALLGAIIEHVSQQSYGEFVNETIFDRLKMTSSGFGRGYSMEEAATGYHKTEDETTLEPVEDQAIHLSKAHAAGALYSTGQDLLKWNAALDDNSFISAESKELMFHSDGVPLHSTKTEIDEHPKVYYGYGFEIGGHPTQGKLLAHDGGIPGFSTFILRFPETKSSIIVLSNVNQFNMREIEGPLTDILWP